MSSIRHPLFLVTIALASACGSERQPMGRPVQRSAEAFLGPIPADFRNGVGRSELQAAVQATNQDLKTMLAELAAETTIDAREANPTNGLPEIRSCGELNRIAGGLLPREALSEPRRPIATADLKGLNCRAMLARLGSGVPHIAAALEIQFQSLTALELTSDDCTKAVESTRRSPRAAVAYALNKAKDGSNLYLNQFTTPFVAGIVEGGAHDAQLALRSELDVEAQSRDAWGTLRTLGQKAAVASWMRSSEGVLDSHRVEYLDVATRAADGQNAAGRLWLSTEASFQFAEQFAFTEETDWTFIANGVTQQSDHLVIKGTRLGTHGLKLDIHSQFPGQEQNYSLTCNFRD